MHLESFFVPFVVEGRRADLGCFRYGRPLGAPLHRRESQGIEGDVEDGFGGLFLRWTLRSAGHHSALDEDEAHHWFNEEQRFE